MCAIIDASVAHEVFGDNRPEAGEEFFRWINKGKGRLVVGSKLLDELKKTKYNRWMRRAILYTRLVRQLPGEEVKAKTKELEKQKRKRKDTYKSNDPHVLALAQVSGARLLYVNDRDLEADFKNKNLIDRPEGKLYLTRVSNRFPNANKFTDSKKRLLRNKNLCRPPK